MSTNHTDTGKEKGPGIGSKIRGAAQVAHGVGENIRGTVLGAIDSIAGDDRNINHDIAAQGRMEYTQGMAKMRGAGTGATAGYGNGGGFGAGTGVGPTAAGVQASQAGGPGGAYDVNQNPEAADTKHIQPDGYPQQQPVGYQPKQPIPPPTSAGTRTSGGAGQSYDTSAQTDGPGGVEAGGPGGGYRANETSEAAAMKQTQPEEYNQPSAQPFDGTHDTQPSGESQQR